MKVKEIIERLSKENPDEVIFVEDKNEYNDGPVELDCSHLFKKRCGGRDDDFEPIEFLHNDKLCLRCIEVENWEKMHQELVDEQDRREKLSSEEREKEDKERREKIKKIFDEGMSTGNYNTGIGSGILNIRPDDIKGIIGGNAGKNSEVK